MKNFTGNFLRLAISLGLGIGLVAWFMGHLSDHDKHGILNDFKRVNYLWVCIPPLLWLCSNFFRAQRWRILLWPLGYKPGFGNTLLSIMIMYLMSLLFPRLGDLGRCGGLARYENVPIDKSIGTIVTERLTDIACLGLMVLAFMISQHDKFLLLYSRMVSNSKSTFGGIISKNEISPALKYSVLTSVFVCVLIYLFSQVRKKGFTALASDMRKRVTGIWTGIVSIKHIEQPFSFVFHTAGIWLCCLLASYSSFHIFPESAQLGIIVAGICMFCSGAAESFTPGGLGLFPLCINVVMGVYGITGSVAISLGWVLWSVQIMAVLTGGVISLLLVTIVNREPVLDELVKE